MGGGRGVVILISLSTRGFGFVTFVDQAGVDKVLAQSRHELDSKTVSSYNRLTAVLTGSCVALTKTTSDTLFYYVI